MRNLFSVSLLFVCAALMAMGPVHARNNRADAQVVTADNGKFKGEVYGKPAKGSKFTNLRIGMSRARVVNMIGQGSDSRSYSTGKAFNPFYYGRDRYRMEYLYKGSGRLAFTPNQRLVVIVHDRNEDGYND